MLLNLNNIGTNGVSDDNMLPLSLSINDIKKINKEDLFKAKFLTLNHIKSNDIDSFYEELVSFKFKIKSLVPQLMTFKFDKLSSLLILFKVLDDNILNTLIDNENITDGFEIEIIPSDSKILLWDK